MTVVTLEDRDRLEAFFRRDTALHLYELGDLDDFFWRYTRWYGLERGGDLAAVALVYAATTLPVVVALDRDPDTVAELLGELDAQLPATFYAHFTPGAVRVLRRRRVTPHGLHLRMIAHDDAAIGAADSSGATPLGPSQGDELERFYQEAYPGSWFDRRMLESNAYFGVRAPDGSLQAVSGVHVLSSRTRVAALGNVACHPEWRGRGLARLVCAATCQSLLPRVDTLGLNVEATNARAIALYRTLGFETVASYEEHMVNLRT
jgi:ribosomal protein S18 acetylase RimI-like enzyme